ncbi:MAG: hypothetical protein HGB14_06025 [Anaerolineaceae bacterium]|nr:hypothetical protein [Anaerolineaceae bacterium]
MFARLKTDYLKISQMLIFLLSGFWFLAGMYTIVISGNHKSTPAWVFVLMGILMLLDAGMMLICARGLGKQSIWSYRLLIVLLGVNAVLIFADQVGFVDLLVLLLTIAPLMILIFRRSYFVKPAGLE